MLSLVAFEKDHLVMFDPVHSLLLLVCQIRAAVMTA